MWVMKVLTSAVASLTYTVASSGLLCAVLNMAWLSSASSLLVDGVSLGRVALRSSVAMM